jgi:hypothetical protein
MVSKGCSHAVQMVRWTGPTQLYSYQGEDLQG